MDAEHIDKGPTQVLGGATETEASHGTKRFHGGTWYYFCSMACRQRFISGRSSTSQRSPASVLAQNLDYDYPRLELIVPRSKPWPQIGLGLEYLGRPIRKDHHVVCMG